MLELTDRLAALLAEHRLGPATGKPWYLREGGSRMPKNYEQTYACRCREWEGTHDAHRVHVAAVLAEAGVGFVAEVERERDDLRSRLACVWETIYWDRPYDERIAAIRGMCDLTTNGLTPVLLDTEADQ